MDWTLINKLACAGIHFVSHPVLFAPLKNSPVFVGSRIRICTFHELVARRWWMWMGLWGQVNIPSQHGLQWAFSLFFLFFLCLFFFFETCLLKGNQSSDVCVLEVYLILTNIFTSVRSPITGLAMQPSSFPSDTCSGGNFTNSLTQNGFHPNLEAIKISEPWIFKRNCDNSQVFHPLVN